ncbi:right-handed parallel beta-helix repeat-containing protein [Patescibacteria group bacterium]
MIKKFITSSNHAFFFSLLPTIALVLVGFFFFSFSVHAATITVSPDQSIQSAINSASSGDKIVVSGNHSSESISISKNNLTVEASGTVQTKGFTVTGSGITVRGFTIINLTGTGMTANSGSNNLIENNKFLYNGNRGLFLNNNTSSWTVRNNYFHRNNTAGVDVRGTNHLAEGNEVTHTIQYHPCVQATSGADADGFRFFGSGHIFRNNWIHDMPDGGSGYDQTACSIEQVANLSNDYDKDSHTDCFQTYAGSSPAGHDILFEGNICELPPVSEWTAGAGAKAFQGSGNIYNLTFKNNLVIADFISLFYDDCDNVVYDHNTFIGSNSSNVYGGLKYHDCGSDAGSVKNNIFVGYRGGSGRFEIVNSSPDVGYNCVYLPDRNPLRPPDPGDVWGVDPRLDANYHLQSDSPCIGAAEDGSDIGAFPYGGQIPTISITPGLPTETTAKTGDANGDGSVDGADYIIWLNHYGQNVSGSTSGDFNNSGTVDGSDYILWLSNYGE